MTNTFHLCCLGFAHVNAESHRSIIINHLQTSYSLNKNIPCIYIYFDYRKQKSQNLRSLLSSLLAQLLRSRIGISAKIRDIYEAWEHTRIHPSPEHYVEMLKSQMKAIPKVFIVIDALDECLDDTETNTLSSFLEACQELSENVHILFTSRPGIHFAQMIDATCELVVTADAGDIRKYLNKFINSRHRLRDMIEAELRNDSLFRDKALNTIVAGSQGMFLLAHLHMEFLASSYTIDSFKNGLAHLSKTPDEVYKAALERIGMQVERLHNLAINVLTWLVFAERELTIDELAHAINIYDNTAAIQAENATLPTGSVAPSTEFALTSACAGIVVIDKNSKVVRLAHNTAEEYLTNNQSTFFQNVQSKMAETCLSCLCYLPPKKFSKDPPPQDELDDHCKRYPFLRYAADHWGDHLSFRVKGDIYQLAWEFLSEERKLNSALQVMANFQFRHEKDISGLHIAAFFGLVKLVKKAMSNNKRFMINARTRRGETPLHWAAIHRQRDFLEFLVDQKADLNVADIDGKTALHRAIHNGDKASVEVLLSSGRADLRLEDSQRYTPLRCAAAYGQLKIVEMLLSAGAEADAQDKDKWTALRWAAQRGHKRIVELLINHKASLETPDSDEWTLLRWAAKEGLEDFIKLLVEKRVNLNVTDTNGCTALRWAVNYGHTMTAWLLIRARADINKPDNEGRTPLHAAVESCHPSSNSSILCLLLENGAKIDAQTKLDLTPLHIAASRGSDSAVWLLLEKGADPSQKDANDRTALHWAITSGHVKVAQLLIWKAEGLIHAVDYETRTALHYAASLGHLLIVDMLLNRGVDIDICDIEGNTPLHLAVSQQQEDVVACLVRRGADVNIRTKKRKKWTAMRLAVSVGNTTITQALRQAGGGNPGVERNESPIPREVVEGKVNRGGRFSARVDDE